MNIVTQEQDARSRFDAGERGRIDADVLRHGGGLLAEGNTANMGAPVPHPEPPIYTVVQFQVRHPGGARVYDYAAIRAGDGKWYATGGETKQGVDWQTLVRAVRARLVGPVRVMGPVRELYL